MRSDVLLAQFSRILQRMPQRRKQLLKLDETDKRIDPGPSIERRADTLHLYGHMPLGTDDFLEFYTAYNVTNIEWVNGASLNIVFADSYWAAKALQMTSGPLPELAQKFPEEEEQEEQQQQHEQEEGMKGASDEVEGVTVHEVQAALDPPTVDLLSFGWRLCADIVKNRSDKYGKTGEVGKLLVRYATVEDVKVFKPRPEGRSESRRRQNKRRSREGSHGMDVEGEEQAKVHNLVIREGAGGGDRRKRQRRRETDMEMDETGDGDLAHGGAAREGAQVGRLMFNADGSIDLKKGAGEEEAFEVVALEDGMQQEEPDEGKEEEV
jgi:hypothetical protein